MKVANIAFLLDRLAADTPPNQQIRELTQNALEAIQRRQKAGDAIEGIIRWDVDWDHFKRTGQYKLSIVDNGDGMTSDQMNEYLNALAVQGASQTQGIFENFGVGAKVTALHHNSHGLIYQSWRENKGSMVKLHRDDKAGFYGLASFDLPDGPDWTPRVKDAYRPKIVEKSGTKVTLLGTSEGSNTCFPPEDVGGGMNWLITYLTGRYFRIPDSTKIQVRVLTRDSEDWPTEEPAPSVKTFNLQTVKGAKALFDDYANASGTVSLTTADAHWWVFEDPRQASKDMSSRGGRTCKVGIVFQDEVYVQVTPPTARRVLAGFGIIFGAEHVVIYIEPKKTLDVRADTARSRIIINGQDAQEANWFETWGEEFQQKMPAPIKATIDEIMAKTERDPDGKARERILERLRRIRELLRPSRYRRDPNGVLRAIGEAPGGSTAKSTGHVGDSGTGGGKGGRSSDDYLADLVEVGGDPVTPIVANPKEPTVKWIAKAEGTREGDELEDVAAEIVGDTLHGELVKANRDFRGYRDLVAFFSREFNPGGDAAIECKIVGYVEEWLESQLIEVIMTVRNLTNGRTWTPEDIDRALSPCALTTVMMARFHIIEKIKRALGSEIARPSRAA
jgi:hypothetical protein